MSDERTSDAGRVRRDLIGEQIRADQRYQRALDLIAALECRINALEEWRDEVEAES